VIALPGSSDTPAALPSRIRDGTLQARSYSFSSQVYYIFITSYIAYVYLLLICTQSEPDWRSKPWGTNHSCYGSYKCRATWDPEELDYIREAALGIDPDKVSIIIIFLIFVYPNMSHFYIIKIYIG
jgi:hypothetical protein